MATISASVVHRIHRPSQITMIALGGFRYPTSVLIHPVHFLPPFLQRALHRGQRGGVRRAISTRLIYGTSHVVVRRIPSGAMGLIQLLQVGRQIPQKGPRTFSVFFHTLTHGTSPSMRPQVFFVHLVGTRLPQLGRGSTTYFRQVFLTLRFRGPPTIWCVVGRVVQLRHQSRTIRKFYPKTPATDRRGLSTKLSPGFRFVYFFRASLRFTNTLHWGSHAVR